MLSDTDLYCAGPIMLAVQMLTVCFISPSCQNSKAVTLSANWVAGLTVNLLNEERKDLWSIADGCQESVITPNKALCMNNDSI